LSLSKELHIISEGKDPVAASTGNFLQHPYLMHLVDKSGCSRLRDAYEPLDIFDCNDWSIEELVQQEQP
jgi:hypothetical protein